MIGPLSYPQTDVFLVCFSIISRTSFANIEHKWHPEITHHAPGVPIVLVGNKLDLRDSASADPARLVTYEEGMDLARRIGAVRYMENSALTTHGVKSVFEEAIRACLSPAAKKKKASSSRFNSSSNSKPAPIPPIMPPAGKAPFIYVKTSTFAQELKTMLNNEKYSDVTFICGDENRLYGHKVILASASALMRRLLHIPYPGDKPLIDHELVSSGGFPPFQNIYTELNEANVEITYIQLAPSIASKIFLRVLEFWYCGITEIKDKRDFLQDTIDAAKLYDCEKLVDICANIENDGAEYNPSIGTYLNDILGETAKALFLNKSLLSDVKFSVAGTEIYAHRAFITSHCEVLRARLMGGFSDGKDNKAVSVSDVPEEIFLAILEYMYTDHAPIEEGDSMGILVLANEFASTV